MAHKIEQTYVKYQDNMEELQPIKLTREDIDKLSEISAFLFRLYEKKERLFDNDLLNIFYSGILVMTDEMDGTGLISPRYIKLIKEFSKKSI